MKRGISTNTVYLLLLMGLLNINSLTFAQKGNQKTVAEQLGYKSTDRLLIVNNDDAGMCHSANLATIEGLEKGLISTSTIMAPCPWASEIAEYAKNNPDKDFGVHLTHTAEWKYYRWGPVASRDKVKGLIDMEGYLYRDVMAVYEHATPDEALIEGRAQIQKLIDAGVPVTHIDSHMGTVQVHPEYFKAYIQLAAEFNLPMRMASRETMERYGAGNGKLRDELKEQGFVFTDNFIHDEVSGSAYGKANTKEFWTNIIKNLKPGITELFIHATVLTDESRSITGSAQKRAEEYDCFVRDPDIRQLLQDEGIILIGYRPLMELQRKIRNTVTEEVALREAIEKRSFMVEVNRVIPMEGNSRMLTSVYSLEIDGDNVKSFLPFFGRAYSVPYDGGKGLIFESILTDYKSNLNKKGNTEIEFKTRTNEDHFAYRITVSTSGSASINVTSINRQAISFHGKAYPKM